MIQYQENFDIGFSLEGKTALITGAGNGIGRAIAELYAQKGAALILVDISEQVREVARELAVLTQVQAIVSDITTKEAISGIMDQISVDTAIDILVNCAGVAMLERAEILPEEAWDRTMSVNLKAVFLLSQAIGGRMILRGGGKIINIASQAAVIALNQHIAYCASKAAVVAMTKVLALEWSQYNISVNAVSPTVVLTDLGKKAWAGQVGEEMKKRIPAGRFAYPNEIAAVAVFLASDAASMISGENLVIDGGYSIQ